MDQRKKSALLGTGFLLALVLGCTGFAAESGIRSPGVLQISHQQEAVVLPGAVQPALHERRAGVEEMIGEFFNILGPIDQ